MYITQQVIAYTRIIQNADRRYIQLKNKRDACRYILIFYLFPYDIDREELREDEVFL